MKVSVTKLISLLHKEGLLKWANKIGLEGINIKDYQSKSKKDGSDKHLKVERFLMFNESFDGCEILRSNLSNYKIIGVEHIIDNGYINGRVDLILENIAGEKIIVDFKSTKGIYLDQKLQLSAYKHIYGAKYIAIIDFDTYQIKPLVIDSEKYFNIIRSLYSIYVNLTQLGEKF